MAPGRGTSSILRSRVAITRPQCRRFSDFVRKATDPTSKSQIYISRSRDPFLNLSIEHYLLQKTPEDSTVLFLYTNSPCIVIGRNQNPWNEVDLWAIRRSPLDVKLVRRRSGGGSVFHDEGNVNYSVICPTVAFNRDKHAEMVVRALHKLGVQNARVNTRHDIVMEKTQSESTQAFKISGSAYKLTRLRSLHHGTCLLSSPHLEAISEFLHSPAKAYIEARGVDSVSSPITNVGLDNQPFEDAVVAEFNAIYPDSSPIIVNEAEKMVPEIARGLEELRSPDWIYNQTPLFTFSPLEWMVRNNIPSDRQWIFHESIKNLSFTAKHGQITDFSIDSRNNNPSNPPSSFQHILNSHLHEINFRTFFQGISGPSPTWNTALEAAGRQMNRLFGGPSAYNKMSLQDEKEPHLERWNAMSQ